MATENGKQAEAGSRQSQPKSKLLLSLRLAAVLATATATVVMALNKQSTRMAVAVVGTSPILKTFTAAFQQTPAFVNFVIANAIASLYNLLVLLLRPFLKAKPHDILVHLLDEVIFALVATGAAAAASMAELGKNGNVHARWNPICDRFEAFCIRGGLALMASFAGALLLLLMNAFSTFTLHKSVLSQD
ncbi:unnamed protein product [Musa acuminata var. zebrina]